MDKTDGQYFYARYRRRWAVWQNHKCDDGFEYGTFIRDFATKEEARKEVFRLNNWEYGN